MVEELLKPVFSLWLPSTGRPTDSICAAVTNPAFAHRRKIRAVHGHLDLLSFQHHGLACGGFEHYARPTKKCIFRPLPGGC